MATESLNITEDAEMAECDGDKVVTMMDVLQEQQDFEEDANAVLGASDDKNCTYAKGYIKRQAVYACLTCCPDVKTDPTKRAGVCLACSLNCHENHELVELYTKRNFRCDCGNPKFNSNVCQFTPNKTDLNNDNIYNQNFSGLYCTCQRPYPDLEATFEDDMIQCIICEDWLHASHLDAAVPANDQYSEMICRGCMEKNEFLHDYSDLTVNVEIVDVITINGIHSDNASVCNGDVAKALVKNAEEELLTSNGPDVDMIHEKQEKCATTVDSKNCDEQKIEQTEEQVTEQTEIASEGKVQNNDAEEKVILETISMKSEGESTEAKSEPDSTESKETGHDANKDDNTITKKYDTVSGAIDNKDTLTDEKNETTNDTREVAKEQNETGEQLINDVNTDNDKTDRNKTEDQLLNDNSLEELKAVTEETCAEEQTKDKVEKTETLENVEHSIKSDNSIDKTETTPSKEINQTNDGTGAKPAPECGNIEVPDTSQKSLEKENMDDKTDSVMDAIDALLESSAEEKDYDGRETDNESKVKTTEDKQATQDPNDIDMCQKETKENDKLSRSTESSTTDSQETSAADVEMADVKTEKESSENENKISNEVLINPGKNVSVSDDTTKITNTQSESSIDADENPALTNNLVNVNEALNKTDCTNKEVSDNKSKSESADEDKLPHNDNIKENKRKLSITEESSPKKVKLNTPKCDRPKGVKKVHKGATFWPSNFRQRLCTCGECISMYKDLNVLFLTDLEDTVSYYENLGKENIDGGASQYEKGLQALSSLDRIQQINALTEYNKMRDKLLDFLKSFKDRKEIVKEEDIKAFFAGMKMRREPDGVYFCR